MRLQEKKTIFLADDDKKIRKEFVSYFKLHSFNLFNMLAFSNGKDLVEKVNILLPDIIVIDQIMPLMDGFDVIRVLKKDKRTSHIPLIMLFSEFTSVKAKIKVLELGASEYISKPCSPRLVEAHIKAVFKRIIRKEEQEKVLNIGKIYMKLKEHKVFVNNKLVYLPSKEYNLLHLLIKNYGRVLSKEYISETVWGERYFNTSHTIESHINLLRYKLGREGEKIKTIRGFGYKIEAERDDEDRGV